MKHLTILMWKHFLVRKRRIVNSVVDLVVPLIIFIFFLGYKKSVKPYKFMYDQPVPGEIRPIPNSDIIELADVTPPPHWIAYYPGTNLANKLMDEVGAKLGLKRLDFYPTNSERGYFSYSNTSGLPDIAPNMKTMEAIIIFHDNMFGTTWPDHLNYTIRMKGDFGTEYYDSNYNTGITGGESPRMYGLKYGTFMRIQWAVDTSYIKLLTGNDIRQFVSLQEFPLAPFLVKREQAIEAVCMFLHAFTWVSLMLTFTFQMNRLLRERSSGVQELLLMAGVSLNLQRLSHLLNVLPIGVVYSIVVTVILKISANPYIQYSEWYLIVVLNFLYFCFVVSFACACNFVLQDCQYTSVTTLIYLLAWLPGRLVLDQNDIPRWAIYLSGWLPNIPMYWFWIEVSEHELYHKGSNFSNMTRSHTQRSASILMSYIYLLMQIAIYQFLAWYLSYVRPGKFGQALPWNFIFKAQYWTNPKEVKTITYEKIPVDPRYFETTPPNAVVGIKIINVSKVYPKHRALKNVTLDVYKGEITVLLGHNGAGKTTLMSIITGMTSATEGQVFVNGKDTVLQKSEVRKHMGLCAQHDMFFADLTVEEHIMLFSLLRNEDMTIADAAISADELSSKLEIRSKLDSVTSHLSGGMKRRTQLAIALAGGADTLVLDEPTSGLDVETRRDLWDLFLSLRGDRTVLLSTHYMEEADALGDRVVAIQDGVIKCSATPMYLKNAIGTGYRLSILTAGKPQEEAITRALKSVIPSANLKEQTINSLSYYFPTSETSKFPEMFAVLEAQRSELRIDSIGLGVATLEEVFITLCSNIDTALTEEQVDTSLYQTEAAVEKITGVPLYLRQFLVLLKRQIRYTMFRKWSFLFILTDCSNMENSTHNDTQNFDHKLSLDMYGDREGSRVLYHVEGPDVTLQDVDTVRRGFPKVDFEDTKDVANALLRTGLKDTFKYKNYLAGVEINGTDAKVLYTTMVRHAAPVGLNLLSNMLASHYISWSDGKTITTINEPLSLVDDKIQKIDTKPKSTMYGCLWNIFMQIIVLSTSCNSISLPSKELMAGTRHIHVMSGCPPSLHWTVAVLYHSVINILTMIIPLAVIIMLIEKDKTIDQPDFMVAYLLITQMGSMAFVAFGYILSFNYGERGTSVCLISCIFIFGFITSTKKFSDMLYAVPGERTGTYYLLWVFNIIAVPHTVVIAALSCVNDAVVNANCNAYKQYCPNINITSNQADTERCCAGENPRKYFDIEKEEGAAIGLIILIAQFLVFMTIVILLENGVFKGLNNRLTKYTYDTANGPEPSATVRAEEEYVKNTIQKPASEIPDALLVHNIHKFYSHYHACKGVDFSVKKGECFGLLGVNGAGKTTVFKIITKEEYPSKGNIFMNGYHVTQRETRYLKTLGYCPQFYGLDPFLSGEANLEVILTLRGYANKSMKQEIKNWIQIIGMEQYARQLTYGYSGGCLRRMGAAAALCSDADLTLLDEPSAGVDVVARRRLWTAMRKALRRGKSIVITSHSMDEMDALCHRIAIMAKGRVRALGSPSALRAEHAKGFAVMFKLSQTLTLDDESMKTVIKFDSRLHELFNCTLRDEHMTMLHYHINEVMPLSDLFNTLESLRREFPTIIEDYAVSETTLEEVFLFYATEKEKSA